MYIFIRNNVVKKIEIIGTLVSNGYQVTGEKTKPKKKKKKWLTGIYRETVGHSKKSGRVKSYFSWQFTIFKRWHLKCMVSNQAYASKQQEHILG